MRRRIGLMPAVVAVAVLFGAGEAARAERSLVDEVKLGVLHHDADDLWSGFRRESGIDANVELIFAPKLDALGGTIRPVLGVSLNSAGDTSKAYAAARWEIAPAENLFFAVGLGGAVHDGKRSLERADRKALGARLLFYIPIEIGYRPDPRYSISVFFDHVSNAGLADSNEGMDTVGIRFGYRFGGAD